MRTFIACLLLMMSALGHTSDSFELRREWVRDLRIFLVDLEASNPEYFITTNKIDIFQNLELIEKAHAQSEHSCFFAGWPSKVITSQGRKYCTSPLNGNADYKSSCGAGEFQCQPLLFGKGVCVTFKSPSQKSLAFSNCTQKFNKNPSDDYLKSLTQNEKDELKRISILAKDICIDGKIGIQKNKPMCKNLLKRFDQAMKAIESTPVKIDKTSDVKKDPVVIEKLSPIEFKKAPLVLTDPSLHKEIKIPELRIPANVVIENEDCVVPFAPGLENVIESSNEIMSVVSSEIDELYESVKKDFESSPHCVASNVYTDPKEKMSPALFQQIYEEVTEIGRIDGVSGKQKRFEELVQKYGWTSDTKEYGLSVLSKSYSSIPEMMNEIGRVRGLALQNSDRNSKTIKDYMAEDIKFGLAQRGVFTFDDEGEIKCPFMSKDAFLKAVAGREEVLKSGHKGLITKKNLLTVVDLSMPSNQRRMFVIDLNTKKVNHNTWSAHGGGKGFTQVSGSDAEGGTPEVSNEPGSNLSSVGFAIATKTSVSPKWGNSLILKGIDSDNSNMERREVILHGWRTPNSGYANKTWEVDEKGTRRIEGVDIYKNFMSKDFKNTKEDMFDISSDLKIASIIRPYMDATEGCLGVSETKMSHTDLKKRPMSQLDMLREDLPGSIIYQYNGDNTNSKYH